MMGLVPLYEGGVGGRGGRREKEEGEDKRASSCFLTAIGACSKKTTLTKADREPSQDTREPAT